MPRAEGSPRPHGTLTAPTRGVLGGVRDVPGPSCVPPALRVLTEISAFFVTRKVFLLSFIALAPGAGWSFAGRICDLLASLLTQRLALGRGGTLGSQGVSGPWASPCCVGSQGHPHGPRSLLGSTPVAEVLGEERPRVRVRLWQSCTYFYNAIF